MIKNAENGEGKGMNLSFSPEDWARMEYKGIPVYISRKEPNWFVPNGFGDAIIKNVMKGISPNGDLSVLRFLNSLPSVRPLSYEGRHHYLRLEKLKELWFHITNRCNLSCSHCLFSAPQRRGLN